MNYQSNHGCAKRHPKICAVGLAVLLVFPAMEFVPRSACGAVVINEILYHPPDDRADLEYVELFNSSNERVDLSNWELSDGIRYTFPEGSVIEPNGYVVICADAEAFAKHYKREANGQFSRSLSNGGERIDLEDAKGTRVDSVEYADTPPWPAAPDGYSSSLERICPFEPGDQADNWAPSRLSDDQEIAAGSPGAKNASFLATLPPAVSSVTFLPKFPKPGQPIEVEALLKATGESVSVTLLYRTAQPSTETKELEVPLTRSGLRYSGTIPGQEVGRLIRFRIRVVDGKGAVRFYPPENEIRPALSAYVPGEPDIGKIALGSIINVGAEEYEAAQKILRGETQPPGRGGGGFGFGRPAPPAQPVRPQGRSAFVYIDPKTRQAELFDFINISTRTSAPGLDSRNVRAYKVRLHKDRMFRDIKTLNVVHEGNVRFAPAEAVAYELYRRVGNATLITDFLRLSIDGKLVGYNFCFEQPNKAFFRRNKIDDGGNLYKKGWMGRSVEDLFEKKTNLDTGHDDLVELIEALEAAEGDAMWKVIEENFDVDQVVNYFAVNMVLSHWDGYFNNFFIYHDMDGTGKWQMYPWDQDKTQGYYDRIPEGEVFTDMPLTYAMEGAVPPGGGGRRGPMWWRPGGMISRPLLANPTFRSLFLKRVKEITETIYVEKEFFPIIDGLKELLAEEVVLRAKANNEDPQRAMERFDESLRLLREHLTKRREFLLAQPELQGVKD